jgi:hypothetical protein
VERPRSAPLKLRRLPAQMRTVIESPRKAGHPGSVSLRAFGEQVAAVTALGRLTNMRLSSLGYDAEGMEVVPPYIAGASRITDDRSPIREQTTWL